MTETKVTKKGGQRLRVLLAALALSVSLCVPVFAQQTNNAAALPDGSRSPQIVAQPDGSRSPQIVAQPDGSRGPM